MQLWLPIQLKSEEYSQLLQGRPEAVFGINTEAALTVQLVTGLNNGNRMEFGIGKCWSIHFRRGQEVDASCFHVNKQEEIRKMDEGSLVEVQTLWLPADIRHTRSCRTSSCIVSNEF